MTRRDEKSSDALEEYKDAILSTSVVGSCVEDTRSGEKVDKVEINMWRGHQLWKKRSMRQTSSLKKIR